jgi:hypothetical protein
MEAENFADNGVAANPNFSSNLAARKPGLKMTFQKLDAFGCPRRFECEHIYGPKVLSIPPNHVGHLSPTNAPG